MSYALLFTISGILIVATYVPVLYFVIAKGRTLITKFFTLHILAIAIWGIMCTVVGFIQDPNLAFTVWRIGTSLVPFMPVFLLHVVHLMRKEQSAAFLYFAYAQAIFFSYLIVTARLYSSVQFMFNSFYYVQAGQFYLECFILWLVITTIAHLKLIGFYKTSYPQQKHQILILLFGIPIGFGGGSMNFLPGFGINIFPFGNLFLVPIYGLILTYAVLKHQLLNIDIVIKRSVVYSILIAFISLLYLLTILLLEKFAQGIFKYSSLTLSICIAFGLGLIFIPLRHRIQNFVDRYFFKGTQKEIALENEQLRQEVAQSDKYKTLSTLASGVAHEIKNPLTSIKTFCEYLPRKLEDKKFLLKFSDLVGREVDRIDGMVHELLDYSKPAPLALKKTDVNKLIQNTLDTLNSQFIKNHIEVIFKSSDISHQSSDSCLLNIDANRIRQALLNLFLNAIEAMPHGGKLTVSSSSEGGVHRTSYIVTIADTGSGIVPEDLKHIFDPFFSKKASGTGLGLAIVQGIVEQHRGKIKIESKVGVGTAVKLEFPLQ